MTAAKQPVPYNQADFEANPDKYRLFRTARVMEPVASVPSVRIGEIIPVKYFEARVNQLRGNVAMPIYEVADRYGEAHYLYACVLGDFCP